MSPAVIKRFIFLMFIALALGGGTAIFYDSFFERPPGDYETERGDMYLSTHDYDDAMENFAEALRINPDHRGARMGRITALIATERHDKAIRELGALIEYLTANLSDDDPTGRGTLAAAYANLGIVHDRNGRHEIALQNYIEALKVDEEAVEGPGLIDRILHDPNPSTIRKRARYLYLELQKPVDQQVLRRPEVDRKSRTYKP
ncbi:MAG: tetratricopeptide repeat protein [Rhodospirillaceae bacterium]|jgi:tetratricopeptide (TPR) repeat protein|nr:tetratricopeptide repeat protein [Rhodospirillaceae bacterium]